MKYFSEYQLSWIVVLFIIKYSNFAEGEECKPAAGDQKGKGGAGDGTMDDELFTVGPNWQNSKCSHKGQKGICKKWTECANATPQLCHFSYDPIVCCLEEGDPSIQVTTPVPPQSPSNSTTEPPATSPTKRAPVKPTTPRPKPAIGERTFPGCGLRMPKVSNLESRCGRKPPKVKGLLNIINANRSHTFRSKRDHSLAQTRVVGGSEADKNSWPWMAAIFQYNMFLCGGSLISRNYVLSAAHCFNADENLEAEVLGVVLGSHTTHDGNEYKVKEILTHPKYKGSEHYYDITILRLAEAVWLTKTTFPICLPTEKLIKRLLPEIKTVTVTGWGDTSFGGVRSKVLHEVTVPVVPSKKCHQAYLPHSGNGSSLPMGVIDQQICAGISEGGKDACQSDSGGPLVAQMKDKSYVQVGIVSFGYQCAEPGFPGVYARVSSFMNYIYEKTDVVKPQKTK